MAEITGVPQLQARLRAIGATEMELRTLQLSTIREAKILVPRKTGHLGRSIVAGPIGKTSATVEARTPYAAFVEFGTKPHIIRPVKAKALAWGGTRRLSGALARGSSPTHFAKVVHHPGTKAEPYLIPAAKKAVGNIKDAVVKLWNEAA